MNRQIPIRMVLVNPPVGVAFGIQKGRGACYETVQVQLGGNGDLVFDFSIDLKNNDTPTFVGPFAQGPANDRFVYIDVESLAGQTDSCGTRRTNSGSGRDGTPSCSTIRLLGRWKLMKL